ncbi:hypothetical protein [Falsiruegeria litorea]|nr:hypothetical protein [Falsiruegeria litorea]
MRDPKPNANPLRGLKVTLVAGCGCLMVVVLMSSPQVQGLFTEPKAHVDVHQVADTEIGSATDVSEATEATSVVAQLDIPNAEPSSPAENGSTWLGSLNLPDAGSMFGGDAEQSDTPAVPIVSSMPRSRIPVRRGGLTLDE